MKLFTELIEVRRRQLLNDYGVPYNRIVKEHDRHEITGVSRATAWKRECVEYYTKGAI